MKLFKKQMFLLFHILYDVSDLVLPVSPHTIKVLSLYTRIFLSNISSFPTI